MRYKMGERMRRTDAANREKRAVLQKTLWCAAAALAVLAAALRAVPGMRFSAALCAAACIGVAGYALLYALSKKRAWARWCARVLLALFCLGFAFFLSLEAWVISGARGGADGPEEVSCVLILGAGVDGTQPSLTLARRLDAALAYLADRPDIPVIVSGCQGVGEDITEAECMARYLAAHGMDESRIWKEEQASSTRTNFLYSLALMDERGLNKNAPFAVVTSDYHIARSRYIAAREGTAPDGLVMVPSALPQSVYYVFLTANFYVREAFAFANELLLGVDWDL